MSWTGNQVVLALKERFPAIQIYGSSLAEAMHQMAMDKTRIDVANFDLVRARRHTSCCRRSNTARVRRDRAGGLIAITILRGREHEWAIQRVAIFNAMRERSGAGRQGLAATLRLRGLLAAEPSYASRCRRSCIGAEPALDTHSQQPRSGIYSSGPQSMLWAIFRLRLRADGRGRVRRAVCPRQSLEGNAMSCPICGANCRYQNRGPNGECCGAIHTRASAGFTRRRLNTWRSDHRLDHVTDEQWQHWERSPSNVGRRAATAAITLKARTNV